MRLLTLWETTRSCENKPAPGYCRKIRRRLAGSAYRRLGPGASWVQRHVAGCPRCQRRLVALGKVDLALSVVKSQPHRLDLLMRANTAAVQMLSRQLREDAESRRLEQARPEPSFAERCARHQNAVTNVAACLAILALTKAGIFSSLDSAKTHGRAVMKQYYTNQAGADLAREVFKS
jgi:anti-sigma factor RsiW